MEKRSNKIVFGLVTLIAAVSFGSGLQEPENSITPFTAEQLANVRKELAAQQNTGCLQTLLKGKSENQIFNVKQDYADYAALEGSMQDWKQALSVCDLDSSYYEIILNSKNKKGDTRYRMRYVSYAYSEKMNLKLNFYTPLLDLNGIHALIAELRKSSSSKAIDMGAIQGTSSFQKVTVKENNGTELTLASVEDRLLERTTECQKTSKSEEEDKCEDTSYQVVLNWIYNNYISFTTVDGMEGAKFSASENRVVSVGSSKISPIKDIRDIFSESALLASLKQDWIVRNSNKWTRFSKAQSWDQFWSFTAKPYFGLASEFQSYSNKLNQQQVAKVMQCAMTAEKNTSANSGYSCVRSAKSPSIYMFNYEMYQSTLQNGFDVTKLDEKAVYVKLPLMSDATGSASLRLALPRKDSDYFKTLELAP